MDGPVDREACAVQEAEAGLKRLVEFVCEHIENFGRILKAVGCDWSLELACSMIPYLTWTHLLPHDATVRDAMRITKFDSNREIARYSGKVLVSGKPAKPSDKIADYPWVESVGRSRNVNALVFNRRTDADHAREATIIEPLKLFVLAIGKDRFMIGTWNDTIPD